MKRVILAFAATLLLLCVGPVSARTYPDHPIRFIVPFAPGGGADLLARILQDPLAKRLGQPVVIENRAGGGATIGADFVAKAPPDGYTILLTTPGPQITNRYLLGKLPYDPDKDLVPVAMLVKAVNVLVVNPTVPVKSVAELIAYAKANPNKINFSSSGVGASSHLSGELFKMMAGIEITHVPYRGSGPSIADIISGNIQMSIDTVSTMLPHIKSGAMRALAVAGSTKNPTLPELPTIAETLPGFDGDSINYLSAPAGVPQPIIDRLHNELNAILTDPEVAQRMIAAGLTPVVETQADLIKRVKDEQVKWKKVIEQVK